MTTDRLVLDASLVVALLIDPGELGDSLAARVRSGDLHAPDHLPVEVINVLRRRRNAEALSEAEAKLAIDGLWSQPAQLWPFEMLAERAWELGHNVSAYDTGYVALAEHLGASLLTADSRLSRSPGLRCEVEVFGA